MLTRVEQERVIDTPGQSEIGKPHKYKEVDTPVALVWCRGDTPRNMEKAYARAEKDGYMVFVYRPDETAEPLPGEHAVRRGCTGSLKKRRGSWSTWGLRELEDMLTRQPPSCVTRALRRASD